MNAATTISRLFLPLIASIALPVAAFAADPAPSQAVTPAMQALYAAAAAMADDLSAAQTILRHANDDLQRLMSEALKHERQKAPPPAPAPPAPAQAPTH